MPKVPDYDRLNDAIEALEQAWNDQVQINSKLREALAKFDDAPAHRAVHSDSFVQSEIDLAADRIDNAADRIIAAFQEQAA